MQKYIVFIDKRFLGKSRKELVSIFHKFKEIRTAEKFIVIESAMKPKSLFKKLNKKPAVFTENIIPILGVVKNRSKDFKEVRGFLSKNLGKREKFRIEAMNLESNTEQGAKAIEVYLGTALESMGFVADLDNPDVFVYLALSGDEIIVGKVKKDESPFSNTLDYFRSYNRYQAEKVSRAEFKLMEAIEYFKINLKAVRKALDIGAAPGGWTGVLAKNGVKVVAVDNADLDYESLFQNSSIVIYKKQLKKTDADILHIKKKCEDASNKLLGQFAPYDMLLIDANVAPEINAKTANRIAPLLSRNAYLILTVKFVDTRLDYHMKKIKGELSKHYSRIALRKLPHNRMELTCVARRR